MDKISLPDGLGIRLAAPSDAPFLERLFHQSRQSFYIADAEKDYVHHIIEHQSQIQHQQYGSIYPDAHHFIIDKQGTPIGRLIIDFGHNTVHVLDISLIHEAQGKGYGKAILRATQHIATQQHVPVTLVVTRTNTKARQIYHSLGFTIEQSKETDDLLIWLPPRNKIYV